MSGVCFDPGDDDDGVAWGVQTPLVIISGVNAISVAIGNDGETLIAYSFFFFKKKRVFFCFFPVSKAPPCVSFDRIPSVGGRHMPAGQLEA